MAIISRVSPLYSLLYMSTAQILFTPARMDELLEQSRRNNARAGITGLLVFRDGAFMQLLEGPEQAVQELMRKIRTDERHYAIVTLTEGPIAKRSFPDWSLDYHNLRDPEVRKLPGFEEYADVPLNVAEFSAEPSMALQLLQVFKKGG